MRRFIALLVLLWALMSSSTASSTLIDNYFSTKNEQIVCMTYRELLRKAEQERAAERAEQQRLKAEQERQNEFNRLVFFIILSVGFIAAFIAYQYNKSRQFIKENSFMLWFSNFINQKNVWILIFCVVSFVSCILYVPYNLVRLDNPNFIYKTAHGTIFEIPEDFRPQNTRIDYQAMVFREFLILIGCCTGYTVSTMINKK